VEAECPRVEPPQPKGDEPPGERPLLSFEVCGGLTNQRIALVQGLLIGKLTGRAVVLPLLNPNGQQRPDRKYAEDREHMVDFSTFYDRNATEAALRRLGIRLATDDETEAAEKGRGSLAERLAAFFRVARPLVPKNGRRSVRKVRGSRRRPCYYKALSKVVGGLALSLNPTATPRVPHVRTAHWALCHFECRGALLSLDVETRGLPPLAPPPRVCGEVYLTLP